MDTQLRKKRKSSSTLWWKKESKVRFFKFHYIQNNANLEPISLEKCKAFKLKREFEKEIQSIDTSLIIESETGHFEH